MKEPTALAHASSTAITPVLSAEEISLFSKAITGIREEMHDNVYIAEALKVVRVGGFRSAIGSYWNAVVDDLRRKIMHRSLDLFNKEVKPKREVKVYEDFQEVVVDADLIDGAYKIGVITWEAKKMLHHAREVRNVFDGHPTSSDPSPLKVLDLMNDCNKYVLSQDYPPAIIDIGKYIALLEGTDFDRNVVAIEQAVGDLPEVYKNELINRLYSAYVHPNPPTNLRANIEVVAPVLWQVLTKEMRLQIAKRFDRDIISGDTATVQAGTDFMSKVGGMKYVSTASRKVIIEPVIRELEEHLDQWAVEAAAVAKLELLGTSMPPDLLERYVSAMTLTYVGYRGSSISWSRRDFYSNGAAPIVARLFETFDDMSARAFIKTVKTNKELRSRIAHGGQLNRLRNLGNILLQRPNLPEDVHGFLTLLITEAETSKFYAALGA